MKIGDRAYIKPGYGYHTQPLGAFRRSDVEKYGVITAILPMQKVAILLDVNNGWSVITGAHCIVVCSPA